MKLNRPIWYTVSPWLALVAGACLSTAAVACLVFASRATGPGVAFENDLIRVNGDSIEYSMVSVPCALLNSGSHAVELKAIRQSCSCTSVTTDGGEKLLFPVTIQSGEKLGLLAKIDPIGRFGLQRQVVVCSILDGDFERRCETVIEMNVIPGWRLVPAAISLDGMPKGVVCHRSVFICDGLENSEFGVGDIKISNPEMIDLKLVDLSTESGQPTTAPDTERMTERFRLDVAIRLPSEAGQQVDTRIRISPTDSRFSDRVPSLVLPIKGSTAQEGCVFVPQLMMIYKEMAEPVVTREFRCRCYDEHVSGLEVVDAPEYITIAFRDGTERGTDFIMTARIDKVKFSESVDDVHQQEITLRPIQPTASTEVYRLPIRIY